jgi:hypothetical protein
MAYQIDRYNGTTLVVIDDQTINTTATDLRLVGRNYSGYGEIQNENFLHLLENFANTTAPPRAIEGQIWYDASDKKLKYYNGTKFKVAGGAEVSDIAPIDFSTGEFWWNSVEQQLFAWTGNEFVLIGPDKAPTLGDTLVESLTVKDVLENDRSIIKFITGGTTVAIFSKDEFILNPTVNPITGFATIKRGLTLSTLQLDGFSSQDYNFWGTASNSERLNGFTSNDFLRSTNVVFDTQVRFRDSGFLVGDQNDLRVRVINGNEPVIENQVGGNIIFRISSGGTDIRDVMVARQDGILPGTDLQYFLGRAGSAWKEMHVGEVYGTTFYGKLIGTVEAPPGPPGQPPQPLSLQGVNIAGDLNMNGGSFIFRGPGRVSLIPDDIGDLENITLGLVTPRDANVLNFRAVDVSITGNVESTSTITGSLKVAGGAGITGNLNVGGNISFLGSGSLTIPVGNTAQRPTPAVIGMIRYNTDIENFEGFDGITWRVIGQEASDDYGPIDGAVEASADYQLVSLVHDTSLDYGGLF